MKPKYNINYDYFYNSMLMLYTMNVSSYNTTIISLVLLQNTRFPNVYASYISNKHKKKKTRVHANEN